MIWASEPPKCACRTVKDPAGYVAAGCGPAAACPWPGLAYLCGVNEVEQLPLRLPFTTDTDTFTVYPGVAPLM